MKFAYYQLSLGKVKITYQENCIYGLSFCEKQDTYSKTSDYSDYVYAQLCEYLSGKRQRFDINYLLNGTDFQIKVWQAISKIPFGATKTYKEIAELIGSPKAFRAVGSACNKNPVLILVPCHRVVGKSSLAGYSGGVFIKEQLLSLEKYGI